MDDLAERSSGGLSASLRIGFAVASAVILTFFATQIFLDHKVNLPYKIGIIVAIALIGFGGIHAILSPEPDEAPPAERLYTAGEVAALVAAVQSGKLVAAIPNTCKFCGAPQPEITGVDGSHYHQRCFRAAYESGRT